MELFDSTKIKIQQGKQNFTIVCFVIEIFPYASGVVYTFMVEIIVNKYTYTLNSGTEGGRTRLTYFAEEGVFFKTSACLRFVEEGFLYPGTKYGGGGGGENPLTMHEI